MNKETKVFFADNQLNKGYKNKDIKQSRGKAAPAENSTNTEDKENYVGLLPDPEILEQYEDRHPGAYEKLFEMAKHEQSHRHEIIKMKEARLFRMVNLFEKIFIICSVALIAIGAFGIYSITLDAVSTSAFFILSVAILLFICYKPSAKRWGKSNRLHNSSKPHFKKNNNSRFNNKSSFKRKRR